MFDKLKQKISSYTEAFAPVKKKEVDVEKIDMKLREMHFAMMEEDNIGDKDSDELERIEGRWA